MVNEPLVVLFYIWSRSSYHRVKVTFRLRLDMTCILTLCLCRVTLVEHPYMGMHRGAFVTTLWRNSAIVTTGLNKLCKHRALSFISTVILNLSLYITVYGILIGLCMNISNLQKCREFSIVKENVQHVYEGIVFIKLWRNIHQTFLSSSYLYIWFHELCSIYEDMLTLYFCFSEMT